MACAPESVIRCSWLTAFGRMLVPTKMPLSLLLVDPGPKRTALMLAPFDPCRLSNEQWLLYSVGLRCRPSGLKSTDLELRLIVPEEIHPVLREAASQYYYVELLSLEWFCSSELMEKHTETAEEGIRTKSHNLIVSNFRRGMLQRITPDHFNNVKV